MDDRLVVLQESMSSERADRTLELIKSFGDYPMYVEDVIEDGIDKGMVRRHDAVLHYVRAQMTRPVESMQDIGARTNLFRGVFAQGDRVMVDDADELLYHHQPVSPTQANGTHSRAAPTR